MQHAESCDTVVVLSSATKSAITLFGKNSDRPPEECQPLVQRSRASHAPETFCTCQFVKTVPQISETYAHIGSRPHWCWGYEHGINEHGVCIGNEALFSKLPRSETPLLIGMELVRLGLERGRTAVESVEAITGLISEFGQGAFENSAGVMTYDNGFIVADAQSAWVIETAGFHWAVKKIGIMEPISNCHSIGTDWERLSPGCIEAAVAAGWWPVDAAETRFNFKTAFENPNPVPFEGYKSTGEQRLKRQIELLQRAEAKGPMGTSDMMEHLCDHGVPGDQTSPLWPWQSVSEPTASICRHSPTSQTTATFIAEVGSGVCVCWYAWYNPCLTVYFPIFPAGTVPTELSIGTDTSLWWVFRRVEKIIATAPTPEKRLALIQVVQQHWNGVQQKIMDATRSLLAKEAVSAEELTEHMASSWQDVLAKEKELLHKLESQ